MILKRILFGLSIVKRSTYSYGICILILAIFSSLLYPISHDIPLNAQKINNISEVINSDGTVLKNSTNDGILDVLFEPIPYPAKLNFDSMKFELSFLKPNTSQLQDHVDFNLKIFKNDKQVFQATNQTGQTISSITRNRWIYDNPHA